MHAEHLRRLAAASLFLLVPWLIFWPVIAAGSLLGPGDGLAYYLPMRVLAAKAWLAAEVPFWNPYNFSGMPLLATLQGGVFFPGNFPFLLFPPVTALNVTVILAFSLAGYATYAFCRAIACSRAGAIAAGLTFMLSGFMVGHVVHVTILQAAALMPALLWAVERYALTRSRRYALAGSLLLACAILAGHPQTVAYGMLAVGPYALWRASGLAGADRWRFLAGIALGGVLAVGLAFIQLAPTMALIPETQRSAFTYTQLLHDSLPPRQLATLLFPYLFGALGSTLYPVQYWGAGTDSAEGMAYVGLAGLTLALVAVLLARRQASARFWVIVLVVALMLACGDATPLFKLTTLVPPYNAMRAPGRHLLEAHLAIAILAGLGLTWLQAQAEGARSRLAIAGGLVAAGLVAGALMLAVAGGAIAARLQPYFGVDLASALSVRQPAVWVPLLAGAALAPVLVLLVRHPRGLGPAALLGYLVLDLGSFSHQMDWNTLRPATPVLPAYAEGTLPPGERRVLAVSDRFGYFQRDLLEAMVLPGPSAIAGIRSAGGYDAFIKARYSRLLDGATSGGALKPSIVEPGSHVLDILGVRQLRLDPLLQAGSAWPQALARGGYVLARQVPNAAIYENPGALPRAWRVEEARVLPEAALDRHLMADPAFDPRRVALLEAGPAPVVTPGTAEAGAAGHNRILGRTEGPGPGLVVVSESYDPGWRAFSAAGELPVRRVDGLVLGVEVPAGRVGFELRYAPPRWPIGLAVSASSSVGLLAWALWGRIRRGREWRPGRLVR